MLSDSESPPSAGACRRLFPIRCRREEVFAGLQKAAAVGRRISQSFKRSLPSGGGFRRASKGRCRREEDFAELQKAAAVGRRISRSFKRPLPPSGAFRSFPTVRSGRGQRVAMSDAKSTDIFSAARSAASMTSLASFTKSSAKW